MSERERDSILTGDENGAKGSASWGSGAFGVRITGTSSFLCGEDRTLLPSIVLSWLPFFGTEEAVHVQKRSSTRTLLCILVPSLPAFLLWV